MRAARIDKTHPAIVDALRRSGAKVQSLAGVGKGVPDLLVGHRGRLILVECKSPNLPPSKRRTPEQVKWHAEWQGAPVYVVESVEQALALLASNQPGKET